MPQTRSWQEMYGRIAQQLERQTGADLAALRLDGVGPDGRLEPARWLRRAYAANR